MTDLVNQLRNHLSSISDEQFLLEWAEIEVLGIEGPDAEEYFSFISNQVFVFDGLMDIKVSKIFTATIIHSSVAKTTTDLIGNYQYAMAA